MNVKFGKREQIVVIVLTGLITIGALHIFVFQDHASEYRDSRQRVSELQGQIRELVKIRDPKGFDKFKGSNKDFETNYANALTSFGLIKPPAFDVPATVADVVLDPPPPTNISADQVTKQKQARFQAILEEKLPEQIKLVFAEIDKLRSRDPRLPANVSDESKMSFLSEGLRGSDPNAPGSGWNLPTRLPPAIYSGADADVGRIKDTLGEIHQTKGILKSIGSTMVDLLARQRAYYEQNLAVLGIDNNLYRDLTTPNNLPSMGYHVSLIHKLVFAMLIEDALKRGQVDTIANEPVTRDMIFYWLEIKLPQTNLAGLKFNELYFIFQELRYLNSLIEIAKATGISEVFGAKFEDPSYVVEQIYPGGPTGNPPNPPPATKPPCCVLEDSQYQEPAVIAPTPRDLGFCIPVIVQFRAPNLNAWRFIYAVHREFPLGEFDEANFLSASEAGDVYCQVKFLFTPYLFASDGGGPAPPPPPVASGPKRGPAPPAKGPGK